MSKNLKRGDIIQINVSNPKEKRYFLVLTISEFNIFGDALVAPIFTHDFIMNGFTVPLIECKSIQGVIVSHKIRMISYRDLSYKVIEECPTKILEDVLARVQTLIEN